MSVDDHGLEVLKKAGFDLTGGRKNYAIQMVDESGLLYRIVIRASSTISYIGENKIQFEARETPTWRVSRVTQIGTETITAHAGGGDFSNPFDNPESLFPALVPTNAISTNFDGINDYASAGDKHLYDSSNQFSVSIWVKPDNTSAQRTLFSKATNDTNVWGFVLSHNSLGQLFVQMRSSGNLRLHTFSTLTLTSGVWQQVTLTYNGAGDINGAKCYLNGVAGTTPASGALSSWLSGQDFTVGARNTAFFFSGNLDSMLVINKELSPLEVLEGFNGGIVPVSAGLSFFGNIKTEITFGDGDIYPTLTDKIGDAHMTMVNMASDDFQSDVP